ncbi:unnamed protein product [Prunus brigantina]
MTIDISERDTKIMHNKSRPPELSGMKPTSSALTPATTTNFLAIFPINVLQDYLYDLQA